MEGTGTWTGTGTGTGTGKEKSARGIVREEPGYTCVAKPILIVIRCAGLRFMSGLFRGKLRENLSRQWRGFGGKHCCVRLVVRAGTCSAPMSGKTETRFAREVGLNVFDKNNP